MFGVGVLLVAAMSIFGIAADSEVCHQRDGDYCKCFYDDGTGYDLTELGSSETALQTSFANSNNLTFYYHPCRDIEITHTIDSNAVLTCSSSSLCSFNHTDSTFTQVGMAKDTTFSSNDGVFVVIKKPAANETTVMIQLGCTDLEDRLIDINPANNEKLANDLSAQQYKLVLYSKHACKRRLEEIHSMSTGSILVVCFFTFVLAYLILGMTFNHFLIGARGIEIVPNLTFWRDFPNLVKDGVSFIQNGCSPVPTTELLTPNTPNPDSYVSI